MPPMLDPATPSLALAPMEGVTDAPFRALAGEWGGFAYAVTEFLRVSQAVPTRGAILRHAPELAHGGVTATGLPVQLQLLGGDPERLAATAANAVSAGATAIDLNFGCPAKTVNRHDGGATLLKTPGRVRAVVRAVRDAVPAHLPVSAKLRLGWDSAEPLAVNAAMAAEGGRELGHRPRADARRRLRAAGRLGRARPRPRRSRHPPRGQRRHLDARRLPRVPRGDGVYPLHARPRARSPTRAWPARSPPSWGYSRRPTRNRSTGRD